MIEFLTGFQDTALLFSRVFTGILFMVHGKGKMLGPKPGVSGFADWLESKDMPFPKPAAFIGAATEFWGGLLLILGLLTQWVAIFLAIQMLVAMYFNIKDGKNFKHGWEIDLVLVGLALVFMTFGAGVYSFDTLILN